jgi:hypothetical protein
MADKVPAEMLELLGWLLSHPLTAAEQPLLEDSDEKRYSEKAQKISELLPLLTEYFLSYRTMGGKRVESGHSDPLMIRIHACLDELTLLF